MVTFFLFAIITAAVTTHLYHRTSKLHSSRQAALLVAISAALAVIALLVLSISFDQYDFYYSETIRGPFHANFLWLHRSILLELLGGLVVGYLVGHWIYMLSVRLRQPDREKIFRRQDFVTLALVGFVMLAVHPGQLVPHFFSRITSLSTPIGSFQLHSPSIATHPPAMPHHVGSKNFFPHPIEWTINDLYYLTNAVWNEYRYPKFLTPSSLDVAYDEKTKAYYRSEAAKTPPIPLFVNHLMPLLQCEDLNRRVGINSIPALNLMPLRNSLLASLIDEQSLTTGDGVNTPDTADTQDIFLEIYRSLTTEVLRRAHSVFKDPILKQDATIRCNKFLTNIFGEEWREGGFSVDTLGEEMADMFVNSRKDELRASLEVTFDRSNDSNASGAYSPWGAILVSTLSTASGNPLLGITPLEYWLVERNGYQSEAYYRVNVLDLYVTQYRRMDAVNLFSEIALRERLISAYEELLFDEDRTLFEVLDKERYCRFNSVATEYFLRYLNELNNYSYRIAQGENRLDFDFRVAGIRGFTYVDAARRYMDIIGRVNLDCLIKDDKHLLKARVGYMDTEAALTMAEFRLSELSSQSMRDYWRVKLKGLRERMQGPYALFVELVRTENQERSGRGSAFARLRQSDNSQKLVLLEEHLQMLGEYIEIVR